MPFYHAVRDIMLLPVRVLDGVVLDLKTHTSGADSVVVFPA
jgi:hypothetical protein